MGIGIGGEKAKEGHLLAPRSGQYGRLRLYLVCGGVYFQKNHFIRYPLVFNCTFYFRKSPVFFFLFEVCFSSPSMSMISDGFQFNKGIYIPVFFFKRKFLQGPERSLLTRDFDPCRRCKKMACRRIDHVDCASKYFWLNIFKIKTRVCERNLNCAN